MPTLLGLAVGVIASVTADGAYDGTPTYAAAAYKHLIGPKLRARSLPAQRGEVAIAIAALNTMIRTAKPVSVRLA